MPSSNFKLSGGTTPFANADAYPYCTSPNSAATCPNLNGIGYANSDTGDQAIGTVTNTDVKCANNGDVRAQGPRTGPTHLREGVS